jgi:hypothetical protein
MAYFRKRPVEVEAVQLLWSTWSEMCDFAPVGDGNGRGVYVSDAGHIEAGADPEFSDHKISDRIGLTIPTLEGVMLAVEGDWVIKGVAGEFYPCKPGIFDATYEPVEAP